MPSKNCPLIVLIDDDEDDIEMLSSALQLQGCTVQTFDAGDHAIETLKLIKDPRYLPSLIILDYNMPRINGEQVLLFLKAESPIKNVPVVIYSTSLSSLFNQALVNLGAHSGMVKSRSVEEFNAQVLQFKEIALSQQRPVNTGGIRTTSKFFRKLTSFTKTNQSVALKKAVDEMTLADEPLFQTNSFRRFNMNRIKNLN